MLIAKGFHALDPNEADPEETKDLEYDFVVMGRHELVRQGYEPDLDDDSESEETQS